MRRQSAFGKNALAYAIGNIGLRAASFLLIPVYTHSLSLADYGLLATLLAVTQILAIMIEAGLGKAQLRFTPEYREQGRLGQLLGTSILMSFLNGAIAPAIESYYDWRPCNSVSIRPDSLPCYF